MKELSLLPKREPSLREKSLLAQARRGMKRNGIVEFEPLQVLHYAFSQHKNITLGWSGGKCSTIVLHMALKLHPNVQVIFNNTGIEFPENVQYVKEITKLWNVNLTTLHPETNFWKVVREFGFPQFRSKPFGKKGLARKKAMKGFNSDKRPMCCFLLKEKMRYQFYREHGIEADICGLRAGPEVFKKFVDAEKTFKKGGACFFFNNKPTYAKDIAKQQVLEMEQQQKCEP